MKSAQKSVRHLQDSITGELREAVNMKCGETVKGKSIPRQNVLEFFMKALGAPMLVVEVMVLIRSQLLF